MNTFLIWFAIALLFILWGISFHLYTQLKRRTVEEFKKYNNKFVESGNTITEALKTAFDNVKKNNNSINKIESSLTEQNARVHKIERLLSRVPAARGMLPDVIPAENKEIKETKSKLTVINKQLLALKREQKNERRNQQTS